MHGEYSGKHLFFMASVPDEQITLIPGVKYRVVESVVVTTGDRDPFADSRIGVEFHHYVMSRPLAIHRVQASS